MAHNQIPEADALLDKEFTVLDRGFVRLIDYMGSDAAIVQAARVSYGSGTKKIHEDRGLIRYLLRHRHTTPFEMIEFKFRVAMPIFVARQWIRHRTANVNEYSGRNSIVPDRFYRPTLDAVRKQSASNEDGSPTGWSQATRIATTKMTSKRPGAATPRRWQRSLRRGPGGSGQCLLVLAFSDRLPPRINPKRPLPSRASAPRLEGCPGKRAR